MQNSARVTHRSGWTPILQGEDALVFSGVLNELTILLAEASEAGEFQGGLATGPAGGALLFHYLELAFPGTGHRVVSDRFLATAVRDLSTTAYGSSLYAGIAGISWMVDHIASAKDEDPNLEVDEVLKALLSHPWNGDYDLISGLTGLGIYALERQRKKSGRELLRLVIDHLYDLKLSTNDGYSWATMPEYLPEWQKALFPNGYYNLGVAHGVPAVITFLAGAVVAGVSEGKAEDLLVGAIKWLLAQRDGHQGSSLFPSLLPIGNHNFHGSNDSRLAWCYGDLGIASSLLAAAQATNRSEYIREAISIGLNCSTRGIDKEKDQDAGICHGAIGNAHMFNRLFQSTGEESFRLSAISWFQRVLDHKLDNEGVCGFRVFQPDIQDPSSSPWGKSHGFLKGGAGIALCLISALTDTVPEWDRVLALSLPDRNQTGD